MGRIITARSHRCCSTVVADRLYNRMLCVVLGRPQLFGILPFSRSPVLRCIVSVSQVRVRNLTYLQPFSPMLVVAHTNVSALHCHAREGVTRALQAFFFPSLPYDRP